MMIKIKYKIIILFIVLIGCKNDRPPKLSPSKSQQGISKRAEINKINFYFENSLSMNGYLDGKNFKQTLYRIVGNANNDSINSYFVNSKAYPEINILKRIENKNIKEGDVSTSDHGFIFTNAIKNSKNNNLCIVITDGIYSVKKGDLDLVEIKLENAFKNALQENEIETVVLKMTSNFRGQYYSESCPKKGGVKVNQVRPYYILLFGNKQVINEALEKIVIIDDLKGFNKQARFFITKDLKVDYTVLTKGEEKKGNFMPKDHNPIIKEIKKAKKFSKNGVLLKDTYLQFGIAVDYSKLSIPDSYLNDKLNYSIEDNSGYDVIEIKDVKNLDKKSESYKRIEELNEKGKLNYSHIIVVQGKTNLYSDLKMDLNINFPKWIAETGTDNDCEIKDNISTTFAFDRLMNGISNAYKKVNNKDEYLKIKIKINP